MNSSPAASPTSKAREKGKYKEALAKFEAAWAYVQTPLTGRDLAQELERDGKLVEARLVWSEVAKMSAKPGDTKEHADARALAVTKVPELDKRIPTVIFELVDAPATPPKLTLDGKDVPAATLGTTRLVNPGPHQLVASPSGTEAVTVGFTVAEGEKDKRITVSLKKSAAPTPKEPEPSGPTGPGGASKPKEPLDGATATPPPPPPPAQPLPSEGGAIGGGILTVVGCIGILTGGSILAVGFYQGDQEGKSSLRWGGGITLGLSVVATTVGVVLLARNSPGPNHAVLSPRTLRLGLAPTGAWLGGSF